MNTNKQRDGKVLSEGPLSGRKFPRKGGLSNETKGKAAGSRKIKPAKATVNFAGGR
jgi:hypothetical protein